MRTTNLLIAILFGIIVIGLSIEGLHSITSRFATSDRLEQIEKQQTDIIEKQNYLYELLTSNTVAGESAIKVEQTNRTVSHEDLDLFCLAKNIYHEAGVENELGMFAVAQVTINRVRNINYPDTICDVVMQPGQFSWTSNPDRRWTHPSGANWETSKRIARQVIKEGYRVPALQSAIFYHADYSKPSWRNPNAVVAHVGSHIFYASAL
jgi:spore germination cell wall hydrolase CwlJ-like protein